MAVDCSVTTHADGLTATLTGQLSLVDAASVRTSLFKCLAEQPDTLFVDLAGLSVEEPLALTVFSAVGRQAARWPGVPVLFCAPTDPVRFMFGGAAYQRLPLRATVESARERARADGRSLPSVVDDLLPVVGAPRHARVIATEACLRWDLPDLVAPASVIASELITNVVDHVGTMARLRISLRPRFVTIAVRDGSVVEPRRRRPDESGGRGLLLVEATARSWGWLPVDGGKVVWASLGRVSRGSGRRARRA
ncbi:ATP-binding protein [Actinoplanes sp. NPDC049668]|uniref:ATP-binding protein n=1 Tax=unclassified Actinoplanes TaxID=2626549 RepID=UPI0033A6B934